MKEDKPVTKDLDTPVEEVLPEAPVEFDASAFVADEPEPFDEKAFIDDPEDTDDTPLLVDDKDEFVSRGQTAELRSRSRMDDLRQSGAEIVGRARNLFTDRLPSTFDVEQISPDATTNPLAVAGFGAQKAAARLAGGVTALQDEGFGEVEPDASLGKFLVKAPFAGALIASKKVVGSVVGIAAHIEDRVEAITGREMFNTRESVQTFSDAMNFYADTLDAKAEESVANSLRDGDTVKAVIKSASVIAGDLTGTMMLYQAGGINPISARSKSGTAAATSLQRFAHAVAFGLIKGGFATDGTIEERSGVAAVMTAYIGTMAVSPWFGKLAEKFGAGPVVAALSLKAADFGMNTKVSIETGAYEAVREQAQQFKEKHNLQPDRFSLMGLETDAVELLEFAKVFLPDVYYSGRATGFGGGSARTTPEAGRAAVWTKTEAYKMISDQQDRADGYLAEARADLKDASTHLESEIAKGRIEQGLSMKQDLQKHTADIDNAASDRVVVDNTRANSLQAVEAGRLTQQQSADEMFSERPSDDQADGSINGGRTLFSEGEPPPYSGKPLNNDLWKVPDIPGGQQVPAGKASEILERIAPEDPATALLGASFRAVEQHLGLKNIDVVYANDTKRTRMFGSYKSQDGKQTITLNFAAIGRDGTLAAMTLGHERIHPVTKQIFSRPDHQLTPRQRSAKADIDVFRQRAQMEQSRFTQFSDMNFDNHFKNVHEFLAGLKTDMTFRKYLRTVEQDGQSVFRRTVDSLKSDVFGLEPMSDADKAFDRLMEVPELQQQVLRARSLEKKQKKSEAQAEKANKAFTDKLTEERADLPPPTHEARTDDVVRFLDREAGKRASDPEKSYAMQSYKDAANRMRDYEGDLENLSVTDIAKIIGVKNPANPGKRAEAIYKEIDMIRRFGAAQRMNDEDAERHAKGIPTSGPVKMEYEGEQGAIDYITRVDDDMSDTRTKRINDGKKFSTSFWAKGNFLKASIRNTADGAEAFGMVESATGEKGVYDMARAVMQGRQYYLNMATGTEEFLAKSGYILRDKVTGEMDRSKVYESLSEAREASNGREVVSKPSMHNGSYEDIPESLRGELREYLEGRPQNAPNLPEHVRTSADIWMAMDKEVGHRSRVKYRRIMRYAKEGKVKGYTTEQTTFLEPIRRYYQDLVATGERTQADFYDFVERSIAKPESDSLVVGNYAPHVSPRYELIDDGKGGKERRYYREVKNAKGDPVKVYDGDPDMTTFAGKNIYDMDVDTKMDLQKRSQQALKTRDPEKTYDPASSNPLLEMHRNYMRHLAAYYMEGPATDLHSKVVTGVMQDGYTPANSRSTKTGYVSLVDQKTGERMTQWLQNLVGISPERAPWEQVLAKARGNHAKGIFARWNLVMKQTLQTLVMGGGAGWGRISGRSKANYVKRAYELFRHPFEKESRTLKAAEGDMMRKLTDIYGEEKSGYYMNKIRNEVLLGKRTMHRELFGEDIRPDLSDEGWFLKYFLGLKQFSMVTDNPIIDTLNRAPVLGGDAGADLNYGFDSINRYDNLGSFLDLGKELILDPVRNGKEPPPFQEVLGKMKIARLAPHAKRRLAELYARGKYEDFVFELPSDQVRATHIVYDSKLRSFLETSPAWRQVLQYQAWTRGYNMNLFNTLQTAIKGDVGSGDQAAVRRSAARITFDMVMGSAVFSAVFQASTGRLPESDEDGWEGAWDVFQKTMRGAFDVTNPYNQTPIVSSPTMPVRAILDLAMPIFASESDSGYKENRRIHGPSQVTDAYIRGLEGQWKGAAQVVSGLIRNTFNAAQGYAGIGEEDFEPGNNAIRRGLATALNRGDEFAKNYYWAAYRTATLLDMWYPEGDTQYRNAVWFRQVAQDVLEETLGTLPDWAPSYDAMEIERTAYRMLTHGAFGSNAVLDDDEKGPRVLSKPVKGERSSERVAPDRGRDR